ncbi:unnamed protein product [Adineta ricciae]|uniref:VCBS repeat-containing protein n=1 Tax=Adineta ricciae TaxID=249248 RepID=A0A816EWD6_ADIRI|nr:unnamed protein product [Adineta ricciae]CAF1651410.1 unnamed protein product [Adineta ricciae]
MKVQKNGTFEKVIPFITGSLCPFAIVANDFNDDGSIDLIIAHRGSNNIALLIGFNNGSFEIERTLYTGFQSEPVSLVANDYNKDGYLDGTVINFASDNIVLFMENIDRSFDTIMTYFDNICIDPFSAFTGDLNDDDYSDHNDPSDGIIYVLINNGQGHFDVIMTFSVSRISDLYAISIGELNGGHNLDLVIVNENSNSIGVMFGKGNGNFEEQVTFPTGYFKYSNKTIINDLNNDGYLDIIYTSSPEPIVGIFIGTDRGIFREPIIILTIYYYGSILDVISLQDFNNDDQIDLFDINDETYQRSDTV